ncbi:MAG: glycoside hydrolase family 2 TIM barrel-domain containing protein [Ktedonobacteraceae bacterium]
MQKNEYSVHPRPQLTRTDWMDLGGAWSFAYDDTGCGLDADWPQRTDIYTQTIQVPFPPESPASGIGDASFHAIVWYRRTFQVPPAYKNKRLLLHCGAVDYRAQVWVNGQLVITHEGGQTPFYADITAVLHHGGDQVVVIRAEDEPTDLAQPRGKQDWQQKPHSIWYNRTTGIWQPVWLEPVAPTYIYRLRWTADLDNGLLGMLVTLLRQDDAPVRVRVQLHIHGTTLADDTYMVQGTELQRQIAFDRGGIMDREEILWSPAQPNLIDATLTVYVDDDVVDEVQSYVGLRSVSVDNGRFMLNGRPYYLRFALEQGYWPQSHLAVPNADALRDEVLLTKELGFNGVRIHQKVEDPRFLYWCDKLGLLVWGEMANAYVFTPTAVERLMREWLDVLKRDYNHPCIVAWVPINESWGIPNVARDQAQRHYVQSLYHMTKALDPTRPTIGNDGWEHLISDIYGVHDYSFDGKTLSSRYGSPEAVEQTLHNVQPGYHSVMLPGFGHTTEPIMLTECGGIIFHSKPDTPWYGYYTVKDGETFLAKYAEIINAILDSVAIAGFCYTQLTDTGQETNGLLTAERQPKVDKDAIRAITRRASVSIPGDVIGQMLSVQSITPFTGS